MNSEINCNEVVWKDLQPVIRHACEKIVQSNTFHNLVDILRKDPNARKVEATLKVEDVRYNPGLYTCSIGNAPNSYFVQIINPQLNISSIGEIYK